MTANVHKLLDSDVSALPDVLQPCLAKGPFSPAARDALEQLVRKIHAAEQARGEISRQDRAHLSPDAQPYQDAIDRILFRMAGLSEQEIVGIEDRLSRML